MMEREEWIKNRGGYIGGSEAAAVLGLSKHASPLEVYLRKIGEGSEVEDNEKMFWGRTLEATIAKVYADRTGLGVEHNDSFIVHIHPNYPWMGCLPDAIAYDPIRGKGVIEIKTASEYVKHEWDDGQSPEPYLVQLMHNIAVCGTSWGALVVLIGGSDFRINEYKRDDELIELIIAKEKAFWFDNVVARVPPSATGASLDVLTKLYKHSNETSITIRDNTVGNAILSYLDAKAHLDDYTKKKEDSEAIIKSAMGDASQGIYYDGDKAFTVSWSNVKGRLSFDSKALEKELPETYQRFVKTGEGYRRFQVKEKLLKIEGEKKRRIT